MGLKSLLIFIGNDMVRVDKYIYTYLYYFGLFNGTLDG